MKINQSRNNFFGLTFIATGKETNGKYFLSKTVIPAGDPGPPQHVHYNEDESFYIQKGQLTFIVNGKEQQVKAGDFINIEKGDKHTWKNNSAQDAQLLITFTPAGIENMFIELDLDVSKIKEIGQKYGTDFFWMIR